MIVNKPLPQPNVTCNPDVASIDIYSIQEDINTILANCLDEVGIVIAEACGFCYKGTGKNVPFTLTTAEINQLKNPTDSNNES